MLIPVSRVNVPKCGGGRVLPAGLGKQATPPALFARSRKLNCISVRAQLRQPREDSNGAGQSTHKPTAALGPALLRSLTSSDMWATTIGSFASMMVVASGAWAGTQVRKRSSCRMVWLASCTGLPAFTCYPGSTAPCIT